jgi:hypothetical protein
MQIASFLRTAPLLLALASIANAAPPVTLTKTPAGFTLANGIVTVQIDAQSAAILSIAYKGVDMLGVGDRGFWEEKDVTFDASLLRQGKNTLQLTVPAGPVMNGVQYDYLRLEVDEQASPKQVISPRP